MVARGVTVMVTTHFMDEAEYCDRIALIYQGNHRQRLAGPLKARVRPGSQTDPGRAFIAWSKPWTGRAVTMTLEDAPAPPPAESGLPGAGPD